MIQMIRKLYNGLSNVRIDGGDSIVRIATKLYKALFSVRTEEQKQE